MEDQHTSINFNNFQTEVTLLENAGLMQESLLSLILFRFFNSNLVEQSVNAHGGVSAFINNYF
jgi:hypothetical protein